MYISTNLENFENQITIANLYKAFAIYYNHYYSPNYARIIAKVQLNIYY